MRNRSITMFGNCQSPQEKISARFVDEAVDGVLKKLDSPQAIVLLAVGSIAVTAAGVWALTKVGQYLADEDFNKPVEKTESDEAHQPSLRQSVTNFLSEESDIELSDTDAVSYGCGLW